MACPDQKPLFISYSRNDARFALKLGKRLRASGIDIWLDQLDVRPGEPWDRQVETALKASERVLVVLSPSAVASENVLDEVGFSLANNKPVFPVLYQRCEIPFRLQRIQRVDFTGSFDQAAEALSQALKRERSAPGPEPEAKASWPPWAALVGLVVAVTVGYLVWYSGEGPPGESDTEVQHPESELSANSPPEGLRATAKQLSDTDTAAMIDSRDFFDSSTAEYRNLDGAGYPNDFRSDGDIIIDRTSDLMWERSGTKDYVTFDQAQSHVAELNETRFGGHGDWRLPTLEEALSLVEPDSKPNGLHIDPVFDSTQTAIWTADRHDWGYWVVFFEQGYSYRHRGDLQNRFARAVRSFNSVPVLRSGAVDALSIEEVTMMIREKGFFSAEDHLSREWSNPKGAGFPNEFIARDRVVEDRSSNLQWQVSGSTQRLNYVQALDYVQRLNADAFVGHSDWRLPTLEEAMSLVEPQKVDGLFVDTIFDRTQAVIWTADKRTPETAWAVYLSLGKCAPYPVDRSGPVSVRAVRSMF